MPSNAQLKPKPTPKPTPKGKASVKGKPLGIPVWGWIAAAAIGIIIGYMILRKSKNAYANSDVAEGDAASSGFGAGSDNQGSPSGSIALPIEDILKALGLRPAGGGGQATQTDTPTQQEQAQSAADSPSVSDPGVQTLAQNNAMPGSVDPGYGTPQYNYLIDPGIDPAIRNAITANQAQQAALAAIPLDPAIQAAMNAHNASTSAPSLAVPNSPGPGSTPITPEQQQVANSVIVGGPGTGVI